MYNAISAFVVNVLTHLLFSARLRGYWHTPKYFRWRYLIKKYLESPDFKTLDNLKKYTLKKIIQNKALTKSFIERIKPIEAAGLVLALQRENKFSVSEDVTFSDFKSVAQKAATYQEYRTYVIDRGLRHFRDAKPSTESRHATLNYVIGDDLRSYSDESFINRLSHSGEETLHIFTATSQLSKSFLESLAAYRTKIAAINLYICSPLILSDHALLNLSEEYETHGAFLIPGQFITNADSTVDIAHDMVRRVIKIFSALYELTENVLSASVTIYLFRQEYPGVKFLVLEKARYAQLQPAPLSYPNNLYRFGFDISDSITYQVIENSLYSYQSSSEVTKFELVRKELRALEAKAVAELSFWLATEYNLSSIAENHAERLLASSNRDVADRILDAVRMRLNHASSLLSPPKILKLTDQSHEFLHISVGFLLEDNGKIMLIKKADDFYKGAFSIVGGHLNEYESPLEAIARETHEELGVSLQSTPTLVWSGEVNETCRYEVSRHIWFLFRGDLKSHDFVLDDSEIDKVRWLSSSDLVLFRSNLTDGAHGVLSAAGYLN